MVSPSDSVGDEGVPGCRSTKKLPSRKIRGRIFIVASLWMGSALLESSILTSEASPPPALSTPMTLPTLTPAIRTGEPDLMFTAFWKTALSR